MKEPAWVLDSVVEALHEAQLDEHGGAPGLRDAGLLASALARPCNRYAFGEGDLFGLAAAYAFGIARNHPFIDGNKRTAFLTALVFLRINGFAFTAAEPDAVAKVLALAAGEMEEARFADWLRTFAVAKKA